MAVAPWIVSDELWELIEPLLPKVERRFRYPGRKRLPDRQALQGILFVLHTGISWPHLPLELGFHARARFRADQRAAAQHQRHGRARDVRGAGDVVDGDGLVLARHGLAPVDGQAAGGKSAGAVPQFPGAAASV